MSEKEAKKIVHELLVKIMDNGSAKIELGTKESAALIFLTKK